MKVNILKSLIIVLFSSFVGIMANPEILTASDSVALNGIDDSNIVETVALPEETEIKTPVAGTVKNTTVVAKTTTVTKTTTVAKTDTAKTVATPATPVNSIKFAWGTQEIFWASSTGVNAGNKVARYGKLVWGHNYTSFGKITSLKIGDTFTITENGKTTTYKVAKNPVNGKAGAVFEKKSDTVLSSSENPKYEKVLMNALINNAMRHSVVLMTCYGSNGRYIVFADAI